MGRMRTTGRMEKMCTREVVTAAVSRPYSTASM